ncbi:MAG: hypothetical protein A2W99_04015 [Bacteroidetes bacterium GWF2_33_16]|nr:MAG: hypothetical protein A2X00_07230 [Bacteroidetes bacterium GWE2_32_14]OFY02958.1 MAG: hypothetical protein A2W99_04015 [Bacteroidetes bacterium GWF2_33_16]
MDEAYIGSIVLFAGTYAPRGWAFCNGQLLSIMDYQAAYAVIGITYGGDGRNNFAIPDLKGRFPIHPGQGPGLTPKYLGEKNGWENVVLNEAQMPGHTHTAQNILKGSEEASVSDPSGNFIAGTGSPVFGTTSNINLNSESVVSTLGPAGGSQAHTNMPPYLGLNYIICLEGLFPPRN